MLVFNGNPDQPHFGGQGGVDGNARLAPLEVSQGLYLTTSPDDGHLVTVDLPSVAATLKAVK